MFSEIAKQLQLSSKKLVLDCCTRWNATYYMLSAALKFKDVFPRYQQRDLNYNVLPSEEDWEKVHVVCSFLEEFNEVTDIILVLDPRNKMKLIEWCFPKIYSPGDAIVHVTTVHETLRMLYNEYVEAHKANSEKDASGYTQKENSSSMINVSVKGKDKVRVEFTSYINQVDRVEQVKYELDVYLEEGVVMCEDDSEFKALKWWKMNNLKFRILSKMACDVQPIPITNVASKSAFSAGGRVIDPYRASLGVETIQVLLCAEDWLRARHGIKRKAKCELALCARATQIARLLNEVSWTQLLLKVLYIKEGIFIVGDYGAFEAAL
ncbi:hypothetical protein DH2020_007715 [Rehmannia glutinosa]|uniref:Zinc finger BED domain-containing protein RICESLEEPER 2-like n=1 Tax=Rehmannia glutinosa TaxID=99300 RepID=A0ABR0TYY3_REHGL